jgi:hypothetical protein
VLLQNFGVFIFKHVLERLACMISGPGVRRLYDSVLLAVQAQR